MNYQITQKLGSGFQASVYETDRQSVVKRFEVYKKRLIKKQSILTNVTSEIMRECDDATYAYNIGIGPKVYGIHQVVYEDKEYIDLEMDKIEIIDDWNDVLETEFEKIKTLFQIMMDNGFLVLDGKLGKDGLEWRIIDYGVVEKTTNKDDARSILIDDYLYLMQRDSTSPLSMYLYTNL